MKPLMQCTALTALCRPQRYVDLAVDVSHKYLKLDHFNDEYPPSRYIILRSIRAFKALSIGGVSYADGLKWGAP
jgi:hypothetical protein